MLRASTTVLPLQNHMLLRQNRATLVRRTVQVNPLTTPPLPRRPTLPIATRLPRTLPIPRSPGRIPLTMASTPPPMDPRPPRRRTHTPSPPSRIRTVVRRRRSTPIQLQGILVTMSLHSWTITKPSSASFPRPVTILLRTVAVSDFSIFHTCERGTDRLRLQNIPSLSNLNNLSHHPPAAEDRVSPGNGHLLRFLLYFFVLELDFPNGRQVLPFVPPSLYWSGDTHTIFRNMSLESDRPLLMAASSPKDLFDF